MPSPNDKLCFVLMPFRKELKTVYTEAVKTACDKAGFKAVRADELIGPYNIHRDIIEYIFDSNAVIADLTDWNPNVFYELGVAHAIANKTIMIVQEGQKLPFDIHNYRCIPYDLSEAGLLTLAYQIAEYLEHLEVWSKRPTNPVQEFKRDDLFAAPEEVKKLRRALLQKDAELKASAPKAELERAQRDLREREARLAESVSKAEVQRLQKALQEKETALANSVAKTELRARESRLEALTQRNETLQRENEVLRARKATLLPQGYARGRVQLVMAGLLLGIILTTQVLRTSKQSSAEPFPEQGTNAPRTEMEKSAVIISLRRQPWLRATPTALLDDQVKTMLTAKGFYDTERNKGGAGIQNDFVLKVIGRDSLVLDHETGLMWQRSGSPNYMTYAAAEQHVRDVNRKGFAGFSDWRLPMLEEAMSLMEREQKNGLYLDPIFDSNQLSIWTADRASGASCWVANFSGGLCYDPRLVNGSYVRLVR